MDTRVEDYLLELNKQFYQTFATHFSSKRQRVQPGVLRILETLPQDARILDLGCGNGTVARELSRRGFNGIYIGLEFIPEFLEMARANLGGQANFIFLDRDLSKPEWTYDLPAGGFDAILAFAVFHHLPGRMIRQRVLTEARGLLSNSGQLALSVWQFLNSKRLRDRLQAWEQVGLTQEQVDVGDYLLDWREGGYGLRYVHYFTPEELASLAHECGYSVQETFHSDGEGGMLGLYQIWGKRSQE